ncbi:hypothetical protein D3C81_1703900 [compost metagenome]
MRIGYKTGNRLKVVLLDCISISENEGRCSIVETGSVAGGHSTTLLEDWLHPGQLFDVDVGAYVFVCIKQHSPSLHLHFHWHDLRLEAALCDGVCSPMLALKCQLILHFT